MGLALDEAWKYQGLTYPNPAVGALFLDRNGAIRSVAAHKEAGGPHAEVLCLKEAFLSLSKDEALNQWLSAQDASVQIHDFLRKHHNGLFSGGTLYVTLEPCSHYGKTPPCAELVSVLGLKTVVIGHRDPVPGHGGGCALLEEAGVETVTGVLEKECAALLEPFLLWNESRFVFFKHAQTLNGSIDGGYITCDESLDHVHALRNKTDLLVIGGNTVRLDRPTLDARRVDGKAPDVLILSKKGNFDRTIPLFNVPDRKVFVEDTLDRMAEYNFIMIEGGGGTLEAVAPAVRWHLAYLAPRFREGTPIAGERELERLNVSPSGKDLKMWGRKRPRS